MRGTTVLLLTPDGVAAGVLERRLRRLGLGVARDSGQGETHHDVAVLDLRADPLGRAHARGRAPLLLLADDPGAALRDVDVARAVAMLPPGAGDADRQIGLAVRVSAALGG